jgi:multicomponent Na+:H+ antiporter subunit E
MRLIAWLRRLPRIVWFVLFFLYELVLANVRIAWEVLTPGFSMQPGIVRVSTNCRTEWEVMMLANTISLTPGTLSLEVDRETNDLFVHALYVTNREDFQRQIATIERHLLGAMR